MNSDIKKYVSRYVVPFYFNYEKRGYEKLRKHFLSDSIDNQVLGLPKDGKWVDVGFWENYKSGKDSQAEMDIYSYLPSIFIEDQEGVSNLGVSFVYKTSGKLLDLEYRHSEKNITFDINNLGIIFLRNGIGFIWYETEFKGSVSLKEYIGFQHDFKELARTHEEKVVKKTGFDQKKKEGIYESFCLGEWLFKVISAENLGIRFWAERETKLGDGNRMRIPDKALLFQYLFIEPTEGKERSNIVFRIANGYDKKYYAPEDIDENLYKPFGNACCYVSKGGMAFIAENVYTNKDFFEDTFPGKFVRDYFFIYILLIYQSYSCAHYSRLLTKLPAYEEKFDEQVAYADKLESLNGQINLFLVKSVFDSVSNMHHQNGVYRYGKIALCIEDDIKSLTIGLSALEEIEKDKRKQKEQAEKEKEKAEREERYRSEQAEKEKEKDEKKDKEEKQDRKINHALIVFGFMTAFSVWVDALNLVDWFMDKDTFNFLHIGISVIIICITIYLIITLLRNRRKKEENT